MSSALSRKLPKDFLKEISIEKIYRDGDNSVVRDVVARRGAKEILLIATVFILNIASCILFIKGEKALGIILKGLGDGISLIYICTQAILRLLCH